MAKKIMNQGNIDKIRELLKDIYIDGDYGEAEQIKFINFETLTDKQAERKSMSRESVTWNVSNKFQTPMHTLNISVFVDSKEELQAKRDRFYEHERARKKLGFSFPEQLKDIEAGVKLDNDIYWESDLFTKIVDGEEKDFSMEEVMSELVSQWILDNVNNEDMSRQINQIKLYGKAMDDNYLVKEVEKPSPNWNLVDLYFYDLVGKSSNGGEYQPYVDFVMNSELSLNTEKDLVSEVLKKNELARSGNKGKSLDKSEVLKP